MTNHTLNWLGIYALVISSTGITYYICKDIPPSNKLKPYKEEHCCHCVHGKKERNIRTPFVVVAHR